jgi:hypothetical protein
MGYNILQMAKGDRANLERLLARAWNLQRQYTMQKHDLHGPLHKRLLDFIENPFVLAALFSLGGLVGTLFYTPFFIFCALSILFGFHRAKVVSQFSWKVQIPIFSMLVIVLVIGGYFLYGALDVALERLQTSFAKKVVAILRSQPSTLEQPQIGTSPTVTQTILFRYDLENLPISVPAQSTAYILQLSPNITEGLYEHVNSRKEDIWWPDKPKKNEDRDSIAVCEFSNYGETAILNIVTYFDISFYSAISISGGGIKKNPDGKMTLSAPKISGMRTTVYSRFRDGKLISLTPGDLVSSHEHKVVIPVIPAGQSRRIYLVNESKLFVQFSFPKQVSSMVSGNPTNQPTILIRPEVNTIDKLPGFSLPPSDRQWP